MGRRGKQARLGSKDRHPAPHPEQRALHHHGNPEPASFHLRLQRQIPVLSSETYTDSSRILAWLTGSSDTSLQRRVHQQPATNDSLLLRMTSAKTSRRMGHDRLAGWPPRSLLPPASPRSPADACSLAPYALRTTTLSPPCATPCLPDLSHLPRCPTHSSTAVARHSGTATHRSSSQLGGMVQAA